MWVKFLGIVLIIFIVISFFVFIEILLFIFDNINVDISFGILSGKIKECVYLVEEGG